MGLKHNSFKQKCVNYGINYETARKYRRNHPNLTDEQIIDYYLHSNRAKNRVTSDGTSFRQKCDDFNIPYATARRYRSKHPNLTDEQIIELFKLSKKDRRKITAKPVIKNDSTPINKCKAAGISHSAFRHFKYRNKDRGLTDDIIIDFFANNKYPKLRKICKEFNLDYIDVLKLKLDCPDITEDSMVDIVLKLSKLDRTCIHKWLNNERFRSILLKPDLDINEIVNIPTRISTKELKVDCERLGINFETARKYKRNHPELTDAQILEHFTVISLYKKCKQAGISYKQVNKYRQRHPELTDEQLILHYNPYCYYNITGDFVIVPLPENKEDIQ